MPKVAILRKGIALVIVILTLLIVVGIAIAVLNLVSSESRLNRHQVNRIKAIYAAQAAIVFTIDRLRVGPASGMSVPLINYFEYLLCKTAAAGCFNTANGSGLAYDVNIRIYPYDADPPSSTAGVMSGCAPIRAYVDYK